MSDAKMLLFHVTTSLSRAPFNNNNFYRGKKNLRTLVRTQGRTHVRCLASRKRPPLLLFFYLCAHVLLCTQTDCCVCFNGRLLCTTGICSHADMILCVVGLAAEKYFFPFYFLHFFLLLSVCLVFSFVQVFMDMFKCSRVWIPLCFFFDKRIVINVLGQI